MDGRKVRHSALIAALGAVCACMCPAARAQNPAAPPNAEIVVSGEADVLISPTRAALSVDITTSGATATAASTDNARISKLVMDALKAADLPPGDVAGSRISVGPRWTYDEATRRQKRTAFEATNAIQLETDRLDKVATYIDSALSAGATGVSDVRFFAKDSSAARRQALGEAVADARRDAEVIAHAGGGKLGDLVLLSTEQSARPPGVSLEQVAMMARRNEAAASTEVVPPQIKITARVLARWKFVADGIAGKP